MARNALTRIAALGTILIASSMLTGCPGSLENPERFGPGSGSDGGSGGGTDAGVAPGDDDDAGGGGGGVDAGSEPALTHTEVFESRCGNAGCHGPSAPQAGLDLVSAGLRDRTVEVASRACGDRILVVRGDPDASYIYQKIGPDQPQCGQRMPPSGPLSDEQLAAIRRWIEGL